MKEHEHVTFDLIWLGLFVYLEHPFTFAFTSAFIMVNVFLMTKANIIDCSSSLDMENVKHLSLSPSLSLTDTQPEQHTVPTPATLTTGMIEPVSDSLSNECVTFASLSLSPTREDETSFIIRV